MFKTSLGGWLAILAFVLVCLFLAGSFYDAALPQYADPMNGDHIKAQQPKRCPFGLCDESNQRKAETNLTNGQAENQYGQAAEHYAQATAIVNSSQPPMQPMGVTAMEYILGCIGTVVLLIIGAVFLKVLGVLK